MTIRIRRKVVAGLAPLLCATGADACALTLTHDTVVISNAPAGISATVCSVTASTKTCSDVPVDDVGIATVQLSQGFDGVVAVRTSDTMCSTRVDRRLELGEALRVALPSVAGMFTGLIVSWVSAQWVRRAQLRAGADNWVAEYQSRLLGVLGGTQTDISIRPLPFSLPNGHRLLALVDRLRLRLGQAGNQAGMLSDRRNEVARGLLGEIDAFAARPRARSTS